MKQVLKDLVLRYEYPIRRRSLLLQVILDAAAWALGVSIAVYLRLDFDLGPDEVSGLWTFLPIAALVQFCVGFSLGLYRGRWKYGSFDEVAALTGTAAFSTLVLYVIDRFGPFSITVNGTEQYLVPVSAVFVGGFVGVVCMAGSRYAWRMLLEWRKRPDPSSVSSRVIVYGADDAGAMLVTSMQRSPNSSYLPVAFLDDDRMRRHRRIMGVRVLGGIADTQVVAEQVGADTLLISDPTIGPDLISELEHVAKDAGLKVQTVPTASELFGATPSVQHIRNLSEADLLGRRQIDTDLESIAGYLRGKRVLVTGAGGSIGSELCRQISRFEPEQLLMLDRDESALHAVQLSIDGRGMLDTPDLVLADIRDRRHIMDLFEERQPQVVFHAAALKHLTLLEQYKFEGIKSNVRGTLNVLDAAAACGVERFVNISTDKAANPTSVLGYTKRIAERLTANVAMHTSGTYLSVRFGNVLGSRGSVLTAFHAQIEKGGPLTVTDPEVTRFFMTVQEAVQLVIQAGAIGSDGEVLVLDMGEPVKIADVAERLISQSNKDIEIVYTGLRPGEKLHEELFGSSEDDARPCHPLISHTSVPPVDPMVIACDLSSYDDEGLEKWMLEHI